MFNSIKPKVITFNMKVKKFIIMLRIYTNQNNKTYKRGGNKIPSCYGGQINSFVNFKTILIIGFFL